MAEKGIFARVEQFIRRNFLAGLLAILPLVITVRIMGWIINLLDSGMGWLPGFLRLPFHLPGLGAVLTLLVIVLIGFVATTFVSQRLTRYVNGLLLRIPVFRGIYGAVKRLVEAVMLPQHQNFRRVVLIEYPRKGVYAVGFLTGVTEGEVQQRTAARVVNVFVPTTPNPTSGYYVLVPEAEVIQLAMSVEEAFKLVMSGGIVTPEERGDGGAGRGAPARAGNVPLPDPPGRSTDQRR